MAYVRSLRKPGNDKLLLNLIAYLILGTIAFLNDLPLHRSALEFLQFRACDHTFTVTPFSPHIFG